MPSGRGLPFPRPGRVPVHWLLSTGPDSPRTFTQARMATYYEVFFYRPLLAYLSLAVLRGIGNLLPIIKNLTYSPI